MAWLKCAVKKFGMKILCTMACIIDFLFHLNFKLYLGLLSIYCSGKILCCIAISNPNKKKNLSIQKLQQLTLKLANKRSHITLTHQLTRWSSAKCGVMFMETLVKHFFKCEKPMLLILVLFQLHKDIESLKRAVDPKILPKEYGGVVPLADMIGNLHYHSSP